MSDFLVFLLMRGLESSHTVYIAYIALRHNVGRHNPKNHPLQTVLHTLNIT